ncbi:restriction endonuclease subunit S [Oceanobacillus kapialis]|uniref:Restriction endonuclease subunit S n=1 Tax=Oceanobacillus kapialis TaxID=481353 RepID=A0ABW5PVN0_9BACI
MSKFKTTEYGPIPTDWDIKEIKNIADDTKDNSFIDGDWIESEYIENEGIRLIQTGNIGLGFFKDKSSKKFISEKTFKKLKCKEVKEGDILICRLADPIGRSCVVPNLGSKNITSVDVAILRPKNSYYDILYVNYSLNSSKTLNKVSSFASGTTRQRISRKNLGTIRIPVPPIKEQQKIAAILTSVDEVIEKTEQIIEQTERVKKGLMQQLFTKGIGHDEFIWTKIGKIPKTWKVVRLSEIFVRVRTKNDLIEDYPVLTIAAKEGLVNQKKRFNKVIAGKSLDKYIKLEKGQFAYNRGNSKTYPFGAIYKLKAYDKALVPFVYYCFDKKDNVDIDTDFYQYYFLSHKIDRQLRRIITSSARQDGLMNINFDEFFKTKVILPTLEEQKEITSILKSQDDKLSCEKNKLNYLKKVKQGLMQQLLTGKVRVPIDDNEEVPS